MSKKIKDYMTELPHTVGHDMTVERASMMMTEYKCHHLPVLDGGKLVGLVSDRDFRYTKGFVDHSDIKVEELMTEELLMADPDDNVKDILSEMLKLKVSSAIVKAKEGQNWGIFTTSDVMKILIDLDI